MSERFCPRHGRPSAPVLYPKLRCLCLKEASTAAKLALETCRALVAPLLSEDRIAVLLVLGHDGALEERP